ncbi:site-2 protease family protein [Candidatus Daviesbacteria bacterium]|nr:site-2 protease family protein [Candidatus Daviesbacteria bacterium]
MFIVVFIITLLILVLIHEFGHFIMSKKFNIKVLEFGFGIPPRIWGKKIGETLYSINLLPFGGFVRPLGEDEVSKEILANKRSFAAAAIHKRIIVVAAGVAMNLVLAWILFWIVIVAQNFKVQIPLLTDHKFIGVYQNNEQYVVIDSLSKGSPAEQAGIKEGERVVALNDNFIKSSQDLVDQTKLHAGEQVKLTLSDLEQKNYRSVEIIPRKSPPKGQGALGVSLNSFDVANLEFKDPLQKILSGPIYSLNITTYTGELLGKLISTSYQKKDITPVSQAVSGPIGMTAIIKQVLATQNPLIPYLNLLAALSLNLAIINVLPFPGLDGGRLFFLILEAITHKRTHPTLEKYVHTVGLAILLSLIILITISDIRKFLI